MEQLNKRLKATKESTVDDIASSIRDISDSVKSISESYGALLRVNKAVVSYLQSVKKSEEEGSDTSEIEADLERVCLEQEQ